MTFLPTGYKLPSSGGGYTKFKQGENKFRILTSPIIGMLGWKDKKPLRIRQGEEFTVELEKNPKHFWAMVVWNYGTNSVEILEITQVSIQGAIKACADDEAWGSPLEYDLKVTRTGEGMDTQYQVTPIPPKPLTKEIKEAFESKTIELEALYRGDDPFNATQKQNEDFTPDLF